jgi:hypothetical protein
MIYVFSIYSAETGELLPGAAPELAVFQRTNLDGSVDDLGPGDVEIADAANGTYSFTIDDAFFELGCTIDLVIDCGEDSAARFLEDHLRGDLFRIQSVQVADADIDFTIKRTGLTPAFEEHLLDARGGHLKMSDAATVAFRMRAVGSDILTVNAAAEVVNASRGLVRYVWQAGDTDAPGVYDAEFIVTDGEDLRVLPSSTFFRIEILPSLAD